MNFDKHGSNGRVKLICQYTVYSCRSTVYVINILILGGWTEGGGGGKGGVDRESWHNF